MIKSTKYRERFSQSLSLDVPQNFLLYDQFVRGPFNSSPDLGTGQRLEPPLAGDMRFLDSQVRERVKNFLLGKPKDEEAIVFFQESDVANSIHPRVRKAIEDMKKFDLEVIMGAAIPVFDVLNEILGFTEKNGRDWHEKMLLASIPPYSQVKQMELPLADFLVNYVAHIRLPQEFANRLIDNHQLTAFLNRLDEYNDIAALPADMKDHLDFFSALRSYVEEQLNSEIRIPPSFLQTSGWHDTTHAPSLDHYGELYFWKTPGWVDSAHADRRQTPPWQLWPHLKEGHIRTTLIVPGNLPPTKAVPRNPDGTSKDYWVIPPQEGGAAWVVVFYSQETTHTAGQAFTDQDIRTLCGTRAVFSGMPPITK